eukprot:Tbor_TRINITY_DN3579_c0_g1::TRINITY_DN3579_c0_g1_i1::g.2817::m.2817
MAQTPEIESFIRSINEYNHGTYNGDYYTYLVMRQHEIIQKAKESGLSNENGTFNKGSLFSGQDAQQKMMPNGYLPTLTSTDPSNSCTSTVVENLINRSIIDPSVVPQLLTPNRTMHDLLPKVSHLGEKRLLLVKLRQEVETKKALWAAEEAASHCNTNDCGSNHEENDVTSMEEIRTAEDFLTSNKKLSESRSASNPSNYGTNLPVDPVISAPVLATDEKKSVGIPFTNQTPQRRKYIDDMIAYIHVQHKVLDKEANTLMEDFRRYAQQIQRLIL